MKLPKLPHFHLSTKAQLIILVLTSGLIILLYLINPFSPFPASQPKSASPTAHPTSLQVTGSTPNPNSFHNPSQPIEITFNQSVDPRSLGITLTPATTIEALSGDQPNIIIIRPQPKFLPETKYTLTLSSLPEFSLQFTTQTEAGNLPGWNENFQQELNQYVEKNKTQNEALVKLRRSIPINQEGFTINYSYTNNTYTITLSALYDLNKTKATDWLNSQGITDLNSLRINWVQ